MSRAASTMSETRNYYFYNSTALADSRMLQTTYTHQAQETRQQISDNTEEKKVLKVKAENSQVTP